MNTEGELELVRAAFEHLGREGRLGGWELDDQFISPFLQESGSAHLTVSLVRGRGERARIELGLTPTSRGASRRPANSPGSRTYTGTTSGIRLALG